ncbi:MAG: multidrug effflux MFS transporter [Caldimonas sp.]
MPFPPAPAAAARPMGAGVVVAILTLLLGIQPVTTDLYLPALPTLQRELGASVAGAQLTLSVLIICFGLGQLVCGPLSDRFGRRPVLLAGLALYTAAGIGGALAAEIGELIAWRALQGVAMAAAVTCGRSIVRDLYEPHEGARVMSRGLTGLGFIAVASPLSGGLLVERFGWHGALLALACFGALALALIAWQLRETAPRRNLGATAPAQIVRNWAEVVGNPTFRAWAALSACTYGGLYSMLAGSSFVFINVLGVGRAAFGAVLGSFSIAYILGTVLCRRLLLSHGLRGTVRIGAWFSLAGGGGMALLSIAGVQGVWAILLPQYVYAIGHGIHQPCGQTGAIGPFPEKAGTAASLSGFAMTLTALAAGLWLGRTLDDTVYPLTLSIGAFGALVALVAWTLVQRHGEPEAVPVRAVETRLA